MSKRQSKTIKRLRDKISLIEEERRVAERDIGNLIGILDRFRSTSAEDPVSEDGLFIGAKLRHQSRQAGRRFLATQMERMWAGQRQDENSELITGLLAQQADQDDQ